MESTKSKLKRVVLDKPWKCECGKKHEFGSYVAAHWREALDHTCDECRAVHVVQNGWLRLEKKGKKV